MKINAVWISSLALLVSISSVHADRRDRGDRGKNQPEMHERLMEKLNLNEDQKKKLDALGKENREELKKLWDEKKQAREDMDEALGKDASEKDLKALHDKIKTIRGKLEDARFNNMLSIRKILNEDQRKQFHALMKEKHKKKSSRKKKNDKRRD